MSDLNDAGYWLERAHDARHIADSFPDEGARKQMITIAEGYEEMAKMALQLKLITRAGRAFLSRALFDHSEEKAKPKDVFGNVQKKSAANADV